MYYLDIPSKNMKQILDSLKYLFIFDEIINYFVNFYVFS